MLSSLTYPERSPRKRWGNSVDDRLASCFRAVVSKDTWTEILATPERPIEELDSVEWVTVLALVEEEFGIDVDYEDLDTLMSLEALRDMVRRRQR